MADSVAIWIGVVLGLLALLMSTIDLVITLRAKKQEQQEADGEGDRDKDKRAVWDPWISFFQRN